jgi:hypothetical protein
MANHLGELKERRRESARTKRSHSGERDTLLFILPDPRPQGNWFRFAGPPGFPGRVVPTDSHRHDPRGRRIRLGPLAA